MREVRQVGARQVVGLQLVVDRLLPEAVVQLRDRLRDLGVGHLDVVVLRVDRHEMLLDQVREREPSAGGLLGLVAVRGPARLLVQAGQEAEDVLFVRELRVGHIDAAERRGGRLRSCRTRRAAPGRARPMGATERVRERGVTSDESSRESAEGPVPRSTTPAAGSAPLGSGRLQEPPLHVPDHVHAEHALRHEVQRLLRLVVRGAVHPLGQVGQQRVVQRDRPDADLLAERGDLLDAERGRADAERRDREQRLDLGRQRAVAVDRLVADVLRASRGRPPSRCGGRGPGGAPPARPTPAG